MPDRDSGADEAEGSRAALLRMIEGYRATALLHVAARLRIADLLRNGPKDAEALRDATGAHGPSLLRLLRGLTVLGVVDEVEPEGFQLTQLGTSLGSDAPHSLRPMALRSGFETEMRTWGNLLHSVKDRRHGVRARLRDGQLRVPCLIQSSRPKQCVPQIGATPAQPRVDATMARLKTSAATCTRQGAVAEGGVETLAVVS